MKRTGFGEPLQRYRREHGLTQQEVADSLAELAWKHKKARVGVDRQMVSKWERELKVPDAEYRELFCLLYGATERQLGFRQPSSALEIISSGVLLRPELESPLDIAERIQAFTYTQTNNEALDHVDQLINLFVKEYETTGPAILAPRVLRQRQLVTKLLDGRTLPRQRDRLFSQAAKLSGMLGYMAVNMGKFGLADAYCAEAFQLGALIGDQDIQAWARGTESFCAYYMGDYRKAADIAIDGQRYARGGPHAVRLASNGEARALGKLGDDRGVNDAVRRAYELSAKYDTPAGVSPCISFGMYSQARTASNAVTAYVSLRQPDRVQEYADDVMPVFEASESCWSQSLLRLDIAAALLAANQPEPEQAARLTVEALTISAERPITSVLTRSRELLVAANQWASLPEIREVAETLRAAERR
ncbi:helix-turn-helix transcriptional regulator [Nonomuraea basaltis]|uniref:helix-turn-helix transcriptional regulator n=1 Tax=Nonomuraea basaltis TaxID=2495887 RepID=UPI00110C4F48|nr:helix-turn-helix transcriptional regulator [Nonomuraea basaltis]TMR90585.1 helix-turn-helix transcriptional regulator [Nonomuraea basaltis]